MAIIKHLFITILVLFSTLSLGHVIYAPNDIPLLDNRFRIDPETDQITFIFNHSEGYQRVVLVQPDGSKLYEKRHPDTVAWVSSKTQDIVTVQNPMAGPWQAVAKLDGENRIKLMSKVKLKVNRLPLKLYAHEYITTHAELHYDNKIMDNPAYLDGAKLSISLLGVANNRMALYLDDGKHYDELPFDGKLTARLYVDLIPGRYLMHIRTKNDIFIRNVNKDAVVFSSPIKYKIKVLKEGGDEVQLLFNLDGKEIDIASVSIDAVFKDAKNNIVDQVLLHSTDKDDDNEVDKRSESGVIDATFKLPHDIYTFTGKAYATTLEGREIELQLPSRLFKLLPIYKEPEKIVAEPPIEKALPTSIFTNLWFIIGISTVLLIMIIAIVIFIIKRKRAKKSRDEEMIDQLNLDELQPMSIDIKDVK